MLLMQVAGSGGCSGNSGYLSDKTNSEYRDSQNCFWYLESLPAFEDKIVVLLKLEKCVQKRDTQSVDGPNRMLNFSGCIYPENQFLCIPVFNSCKQ